MAATATASATSKCISDVVFAYMQEIGHDAKRVEIDLPESLLHPVIKWPHVLLKISYAYGTSLDLPRMADIIPTRVKAATSGLIKAAPAPAMRPIHLMGQLRIEFESEYIGGKALPSELYKHIMSCWNEYKECPNDFKYPYSAILQSSGFGKSRLLRELAVLTTTDPEAQKAKVLYVACEQVWSDSSKPTHHTVGQYPRLASRLHEWLLPNYELQTTSKLVDDLVERLFQVFCYAFEHRTTVAPEWLGLFSTQDGGECVRAKLAHYTPTGLGESCKLDEEDDFVVVLALDNARDVLEHSCVDWNGDVGWFERLRLAMAAVNTKIRATFGDGAGIFGMIVGVTSKIPAGENRSRSRRLRGALMPTFRLLRPFVLTQTMDMAFNALFVNGLKNGMTPLEIYKRCVCSPRDESWEYLVAMGRPMWRGRFQHIDKHELVELAASKLVMNMSLEPRCLSAETLFGTASIVCRLGLQPQPWSPFSARIAIDFMAMLSYVSITHEQYVSSYSTDPVLTFGAARLWYEFGNKFESIILPEFCRLVHQDVLKTAGMEEVVVAVFLMLLAMDTTGRKNIRSSAMFAGDFQSVWLLLELFQGPAVTLDDTSKADPRCKQLSTLLKDQEQQWNSWKVGFSHFVQLTEEPDTEMLWSLLVRRAAAIMPRNFKGVELLIPIFKPPTDTAAAQVSMILVQVNSRSGGDSATMLMRPSMVFSAKNSLSRVQPRQMIRLCMSLRSEHPSGSFYLFDASSAAESSDRLEVTDPGSYVLCLEGMSSLILVPTVSPSVISSLESLLHPGSAVEELIAVDLRGVGKVNTAEIISQAVLPLAKTVLAKRELMGSVKPPPSKGKSRRR